MISLEKMTIKSSSLIKRNIQGTKKICVNETILTQFLCVLYKSKTLFLSLDLPGDAIILLSNKTYCVYGTGKILLYLGKNIKAVQDGSRLWEGNNLNANLKRLITKTFSWHVLPFYLSLIHI